MLYSKNESVNKSQRLIIRNTEEVETTVKKKAKIKYEVDIILIFMFH